MNKNVFNSLAYDMMELFIKNSNSPIHGREIARRLKANQKTVQNYLDMLEKEKILLKTRSGRNYLYKVDSNTISFAFMSMVESYKVVGICREFEVSEILKDMRGETRKPIIVFGSYAKGYHTKSSDIDILVFEKIKDLKYKYAKEMHIMTMDEKSFKEGIDKKEAFPTEVLSNHILVQGTEFLLGEWVKRYG